MQVVIAVHQDASGVVLSALAGAREGQPKDAVRTARPAVVFAYRALSQEPDVHGVAPRGSVSTGLDAREAVFHGVAVREAVSCGVAGRADAVFRGVADREAVSQGVAARAAVLHCSVAREAVFRRPIARASVFHGILAVRTLSFRCSFSEKKDFEESGKSWR